MVSKKSLKSIYLNCARPLVDREQIDSILMLDPDEEPGELVSELLELFLTETQSRLDQLSRCIREANHEMICKHVHFIAGSASNLGLTRLSEFSKSLEAELLQGELIQLNELEGTLMEAYNEGVATFREVFKV